MRVEETAQKSKSIHTKKINTDTISVRANLYSHTQNLYEEKKMLFRCVKHTVPHYIHTNTIMQHTLLYLFPILFRRVFAPFSMHSLVVTLSKTFQTFHIHEVIIYMRDKKIGEREREKMIMEQLILTTRKCEYNDGNATSWWAENFSHCILEVLHSHHSDTIHEWYSMYTISMINRKQT